MRREIILYSNDFLANEEFNEFIKKLGYEYCKELECRMDPLVINFVKENSIKWFKSDIYKGAKTADRLCGFYGFAFIREIDINRSFRFGYSNSEFSFLSNVEKIKYKDEEPIYDWMEIKEG